MKQKLMVVCGGQSSEHIVSRMSCTSVMNNLNKEHYDVTLVGIDQDGSWYLLDQGQADLAQDTWLENSQVIQDIFGVLKQQDVVLPILHGAFGEDGTIQGLFELAGVPYVGCRVLASAVSMDKIYTKKILETAGIPQVKSLYVKKRYDGKLVCPFTQKHLKIFYGSDASADGKWNKYFLSYFSYHINNRISGIRRGCDIQKYQFIGSGLIISCRNLHRIPGIPQIHKIHTFYHAAVMNIQTWNDSFRKHIRFPPFRLLRNSAGSAVRHHCSSPDGTDMQKYFPFLPMHGSWCCTR